METTFTKDMLRSTMACLGAVKVVEPILPAQINTEPETNLEIAIKLVEQYTNTPGCNVPNCNMCRRSLMSDLRWFLDVVIPRNDRESDAVNALYQRTFRIEERGGDVKVVAEVIALIAKIVQDHGRLVDRSRVAESNLE